MSPEMPGAPHAFLIVDDDMAMRLLVCGLVRKFHPDASIDPASSAEEALAHLAAAGAGRGLVVLTDHDMGPGLDGTQLLEEVARLHPEARRVLLTGRSLDSLPLSSCEIHAILPKDAELRALQAHLRALAGAPAGLLA